jgi:hypothetical protein
MEAIESRRASKSAGAILLAPPFTKCFSIRYAHDLLITVQIEHINLMDGLGVQHSESFRPVHFALNSREHDAESHGRDCESKKAEEAGYSNPCPQILNCSPLPFQAMLQPHV